MAQTGFVLSDEGRSLSVTNDSGTTAITAGDLVHVGTVNDVLTGTAASARNAYAVGDIKVFSITASATGYKTVVGIATEDIPINGTGTIAMEGVFIGNVKVDTEAGDLLRGTAAAANQLVPVNTALTDATTTVTAAIANAAIAQIQNSYYTVGKALTGGSTDGKYIIWKMGL